MTQHLSVSPGDRYVTFSGVNDATSADIASDVLLNQLKTQVETESRLAASQEKSYIGRYRDTRNEKNSDYVKTQNSILPHYQLPLH